MKPLSVPPTARRPRNGAHSGQILPKTPTGIQGLDEITGGGLPQGRPTLVCGGAGCGKTLMGIEFLVRGAADYNEPGVFLAFEETAEELARNVRSLGFDLGSLIKKKMLLVDFVRVDRSEIQETGEYDLEGLFIRLGHAIDTIGAKRVVLDTIESLFSGFSNPVILRAELRRLFRWLKDRGVTAIITGERGEGQLTRQGLEEYVSDCVILLDHRVIDQISTRRLRIVKYRGSRHGADEYPFLIDETGFSVLPITSLGLAHQASEERISSGVSSLDDMLGGKGYFKGSTILASGTAGTGKTSLAAHFVDAASRRGERSLYLAFEESPSQLVRNMRSIGLDLEPWIKKGLLRIEASRASQFGLEMHLAMIHKWVRDFEPQVVVLDPMDSLMHAGTQKDAASIMTRLVDFLKQHQVTALLTNLTSADAARKGTQLEISSLVDTWLLLRDVEASGERNRILYLLKSRGMAHSNQLREFLLTDRGVQLVEPYLGPEGVLTGSMRLSQMAGEKAASLARGQEIEARQRDLQRKRQALEERIAALRRELEDEEKEARQVIPQEQAREQILEQNREDMAASRRASIKKQSRQAARSRN